MVIQTLKREFDIIRVLHSSKDTEVFICYDLADTDKENYLLIRVKQPDLIYKVVPLFMEQRNNQAFEDFKDCFSLNGEFYIVFAYHEPSSLKERLRANEYSYEERLIIGKNLVEKMLLLDMPPAIQYEALNEENLNVDASLTVSFNYMLTNLASYSGITLERVQFNLANVYQMLFARELAHSFSPLFSAFLAKLNQGGFKTYLEIYAAYDEVDDHMRGILAAGLAEQQGLLFRIWERLTRLAAYLKPALAGAIILAATIYMIIYVDRYPQKAAQPITPIHQIGTVVIEGDDAIEVDGSLEVEGSQLETEL